MKGKITCKIIEWQGKNFSFIQNSECEYFPCHSTDDTENFNCLFCFCPLYSLGDMCGGTFTYLDNGIKSCCNCMLPHNRESYGYIVGKLQKEIII